MAWGPVVGLMLENFIQSGANLVQLFQKFYKFKIRIKVNIWNLSEHVKQGWEFALRSFTLCSFAQNRSFLDLKKYSSAYINSKL